MACDRIESDKKDRKWTCPSYYFGLGQTLAYLSFGFDEVGIWQCYDGNSLSDAEISCYENALIRIWEPIRSMVGSTSFKITNRNGKAEIQTETGKWQNGIGRYDPISGKNLFISVSSNQFLKSAPTVKAIREFLEIQKKEVWDNES
jgi:hypothetical protein